MNRNCLQILACPRCRSTMVLDGDKTKTEPVVYGALSCSGCGTRFPVENGVVRFIETCALCESDRRHERFRRLFYARLYDAITRLEFAFCGGEINARRECLDRLCLRPGARVLETGIGTGSNIPYIADRLGDGCYFGIDISPSMLRGCVKKLKRWRSPAQVFLAKAESLPFKDGVFDVVFHLGSINIFEEKKKAIEEMIRVARPGTKIVIADETEKADRLRDKFIVPLLRGKRDRVFPPVDLVPGTMTGVRLDTIWNGYGYRIEFRTPFA